MLIIDKKDDVVTLRNLGASDKQITRIFLFEGRLISAMGAIVGIIEIKSGLDPAGALERLGAMFKSFENTLAEYPDAVTILVASCITKEVDKRLNASMSVRQRYLTTDITSSEAEKRKFVNRLRVIMQLVGRK